MTDANTGSNGSTPYWKAFGIQSWDFRHVGIDVTERWVSAGVFGHQYVECQSNCPIYTSGSPDAVNHPTISYNHMPGAFYVDLGGRYSCTDSLSAFLKVDNLFDRDLAAMPQTNTGLDINPTLYDTIGGAAGLVSGHDV